jgi:LysR family nitrogen assimilation transcriptional regulator
MDLRKLRYFVGVAEAGGFRRASETLLIAQPALSRHIRELECELELKLFERGGLGVRLTRDGRDLLVESKDILERVDNLRATLSVRAHKLQGTVKIGAPASIAELLFGPLTQRLRAVHPDLHVVCSGYGPRLLESLEAEEIDSAIITLIDSSELGPEWKRERLVREQSYLVGRFDMIEAYRDGISLEDVIKLPLVLTPMPNSRRAQMHRLARTLGCDLNVVAEATSLSAHLSFVREGLGFAVFSHTAARLMKEAGPLTIAPIDDAWSWRLLVSRAERRPSKAANIVNGMIRNLFSEMSDDGVFEAESRHMQ